MPNKLIPYLAPLAAGAGVGGITFFKEFRYSDRQKAQGKFDFLGNETDSKLNYLTLGAGLFLSKRPLQILLAAVAFIGIMMYRGERIGLDEYHAWISAIAITDMNWVGVVPQIAQIFVGDYISFKDKNGGQKYMDVIKADKNVDQLIATVGLSVVFGTLKYFKFM